MFHCTVFLSLSQGAFGGHFLNKKRPANACLQTVVPKASREREHRTPEQNSPTK